VVCDPVSETGLTTSCLTQRCKGAASRSYSTLGTLWCAPTEFSELADGMRSSLTWFGVRHRVMLAAARVRVKLVSS